MESVVSKKCFLQNSGIPIKAPFVTASVLAFALNQQTTAALQPAKFFRSMCISVFGFFSVDHQIIKTRTKRDFQGSFRAGTSEA